MKSLMNGRSAAWTAVGLVAAMGVAGVAMQRPAQAQGASCPTGGLSLSPGFCASVIADNLGHVRHLALAPDGTIYANTWSGMYYVGQPAPPGGFLLQIKPMGDGKAAVTRFGQAEADGAAG